MGKVSPPPLLVGINWYSHYGERYGDSLKKLKITNSTPGIYPEKTIIQNSKDFGKGSRGSDCNP